MIKVSSRRYIFPEGTCGAARQKEEMRRTAMINVAVLGYGTIGAGVVEVLTTNADSIE